MTEQRGHILVVDDETVLTDLYRFVLEEKGYRVSVANSAHEALDQVLSKKPDAIILDIRMPDMDGLELMGRILTLDPSIPVVLNSAYNCYRDSFLSWSADAYVIKSADTRPLLDEVARIVGDPRPVAA